MKKTKKPPKQTKKNPEGEGAGDPRENDIRWVWNHCLELKDSVKLKNTHPVFFPGTGEDRPLYDELVKRGVFVVEPLEDGYMFTKDYEALYTSEDEYGKVTLITKGQITTSGGKNDRPD